MDPDDVRRPPSGRVKLATLFAEAGNPALQIHPARLRDAAMELAAWISAGRGDDFPETWAKAHWRDYVDAVRRTITAAAEARV